MRRPLLDVMLSDPAVDDALSDASQLAAMLRVEAALAEAEAAVGMISVDAARRITAALSDFAPDWADLAEGMSRDGVIVPRLVAQLRRAVGSDHAAALHKGATSQDIVDTALMVQLRAILVTYDEGLSTLLGHLHGLAERDGAKPLMAHTRMQAALPFTVAAKLRTWSEPVDQCQRGLRNVGWTLLAVQLGGPVGDRSSFEGNGEEVARHFAQALNLAAVPCWHSSRARIASIGGLLAQITGTLGKVGADVALMAQTGSVTLEGGGASSAMPHKSNPVGAEMLVALARHNAVLVSGLQQAMVHEQERSGSAWTLEWLTLPQMLRNTGGALRIANGLLPSLSF